MLTLLRHLLAILVLPATAAVFVPLWIARRYQTQPAPPSTLADWLMTLAGITLLGAGLTLFVACLARFATEGRGTLAPWDPPRRLVLRGPYRYVRNPMISGVTLVLFGEALVLRSPPHGWWALAFVAINAVYIPLVEEPQLENRFGENYRRYKRHVRRFIPRLHPWSTKGG